MGTRSLRYLLSLSLLLTLATNLPAVTNRRSNSSRSRRFSRIRWNPVFRGSRESLLLQNEEIDRLQLPRIENDEELGDLIEQQQLVPLPESEALRIAPNLKPENRYCKSWTAAFLSDLSENYYRQFHQPIQVNSAVRTVKQQKKLRRHNRNAAPETGEIASSHLAGLTVDISKRGLSKEQRSWLNSYMLPLKQAGLIEPEEERRQPVFHIMVSERYAYWKELLQAEAGGQPGSPAGK